MNYVRKDQSIKCNCECDYSLKQKVHLEIHTKSKHEVKLSDIKKQNCGIDEQRNFMDKHRETIKRPFLKIFPSFPLTLPPFTNNFNFTL